MGGNQELLIHVDDAGAQGPITIDPFVQEAKLTASDGATNNEFGDSVSISGNTVVVGAPDAKVGSNSQQGAAYVFTEPGSGWANMTQTAKLTASDGAAATISAARFRSAATRWWSERRSHGRRQRPAGGGLRLHGARLRLGRT